MPSKGETTNVSFEELPEEDQQLIDGLAEDFKLKCMESYGKTQGRIHKTSRLPQIVISGQKHEDTKLEKQFVADTIHKSVHNALGNHNKLFVTSLQNVMKEVFHGVPIDQEGMSYFNQETLAAEVNKESMETIHTPGASKAAATQKSPMQYTQTQQGVIMKQPTTPSPHKIAPSYQRIIRDVDPAYFSNQIQGSTSQGAQYGEVPQGFHTISGYHTYNYLPHPGYHNAHNYNIQQGQNQRARSATGFNPDEMANRITDMMQSQFGLKPKDQTVMYRRPYPEWFNLVALPPRYRVPGFSKFSGQN